MFDYTRAKAAAESKLRRMGYYDSTLRDDTIRRAWERRGKFDPERGTYETFVSEVAESVVGDDWREAEGLSHKRDKNGDYAKKRIQYADAKTVREDGWLDLGLASEAAKESALHKDFLADIRSRRRERLETLRQMLRVKATSKASRKVETFTGPDGEQYRSMPNPPAMQRAAQCPLDPELADLSPAQIAGRNGWNRGRFNAESEQFVKDCREQWSAWEAVRESHDKALRGLRESQFRLQRGDYHPAMVPEIKRLNLAVEASLRREGVETKREPFNRTRVSGLTHPVTVMSAEEFSKLPDEWEPIKFPTKRESVPYRCFRGVLNTGGIDTRSWHLTANFYAPPDAADSTA
jgi:hypothetical protein